MEKTSLHLRLRALSSVSPRCTEHQFHVRRSARDAIGFDSALFSIRGDVVFSDLHAAHELADAINQKQGSHLRAVELHAMGLIHEVLHAVIALYRTTVKADAFTRLLAKLRSDLGADLERTLLAFVDTYPPPAVYRGEQTPEQFLRGESDGMKNEEWVLEEIVLLWLSNENPAYAPIRSLIGDDELRRATAYPVVIASVQEFFHDEPRLGSSEQSLLELLLAPVHYAPSSLTGQLEFMRTSWGLELTKLDAWRRLLSGFDHLKEEDRWFARVHQGPETVPNVTPPSFEGELYEVEPERFSADLAWMPRVVMIAKSTFVWLDQLAKKYRREVRTLRDIPDEELEQLARRGFTALWLIGVWQRSAASRRIKQMQGNPDALASAYSLHDYAIAHEIGGDDAYRDLRERAQRRGIRLASDMVPNHMGIDSRWVVEHPDWFVQSDRPPFPSYSFTGADVAEDDRVGIYLEDGYWNRTDAAVVFKRLDKHTGSARFVYHGNDGTSMPWNDTAQLDYLLPQVREAVIQTILHVARMFPIIRFDAAMTLAKRHYQRLWFPLPGSGGDIPSRAQHAMTKEEFDHAFPVEFWREVVDRVAKEAPDTLLLAEAFWMMEGYFVRTLGMHRVYNSAFMNMLKREENAAYRTSLRNVLEYDRRILERHVNFMNNPDEETAVAQFGKDDKYFGVCIVMATMPGLPMFGHGQIEGFTEKYGMEYQRAMRDEQPDTWLEDRHAREVFPLLRQRHLFSGVEGFALYDFVAPEGHVDEDVLAYSNGVGAERSLVVFHNKYKDTCGRVRTSVGFRGPSGGIEQLSLGDALAIHGGDDRFVVYRDVAAGLDYVRASDELRSDGLYVALGAFKYHVFLGFREVTHTEEEPWRDLAKELRQDGGASSRGVPSADEALKELRYKSIHASFYEAIAPGSATYLMAGWDPKTEHLTKAAARALLEKLGHLVRGVAYLYEGIEAPDEAAVALVARLEAALARSVDEPLHGIVVAWLFTEALRELFAVAVPDAPRLDVMERWHLRPVLLRAFRAAGLGDDDARARATLVELLVRNGPPDGARFVLRAMADEEARALLGINSHAGVTWFKKESAEHLVDVIDACAMIAPRDVDELRAAIAASGYRVGALREAFTPSTGRSVPRPPTPASTPTPAPAPTPASTPTPTPTPAPAPAPTPARRPKRA